MDNIKKERLAYKGNHKGYIFTCTYLLEPKGEALIEIEKDGKLLREFLFPAYKVFNIPAHVDDIVEGLERNSDSGLRIAGSNGLGGNAYQDEATRRAKARNAVLGITEQTLEAMKGQDNE